MSFRARRRICKPCRSLPLVWVRMRASWRLRTVPLPSAPIASLLTHGVGMSASANSTARGALASVRASTVTPVDEEGTQRFPASNLLDLPPRTREFLEDLRPEEIEALRLIVRMGPEGIKSVIGSVDFWRSVATVGKFMKWVLIVLFGTIAAGFVIIKDIVEGWEVVKGLWK